MTAFKLRLPTDIPWRRVCVSTDMLDPLVCDDERPQRWRSSMAVFRYDPDDEYQPYQDERVSYVKIAATIGPFQWNEPGLSEVPKYVPPQLVGDAQESYPCYGAVLQVAVAPPASQKKDFPANRYPYFIDFEPKKRELFEAVTDTGEVLSGSMSTVSLGKAVTDTHSTEDYNLDLGGGGGFGIGYAGIGINANWSSQQQSGTIKKDARQVQNVRSTDFSTERRELQSHTTQLTQMYNLFQAFHLGTNRAVFLIEPRPHVRQLEATFVNGPRALEGIQEIMLVVVRPKDMKDFCLNALLETAHLTYESREDFTYETLYRTFDLVFRWFPLQDEKQQTFNLDEGWEIDTSKGIGGYAYAPVESKEVKEGPTFHVSADKRSLTVAARVGTEGRIRIEITIYAKTKEKGTVETIRHLFLSARDLCCCPPVRQVKPGWITTVVDLGKYRWKAHVGPMDPSIFMDGRRIAAKIREEVMRSFCSPTRQRRGDLQFTETDAFHTRIANLLQMHGEGLRLAVPISQAPVLDKGTKSKLSRELGDKSIGEVLMTDATLLARALETNLASIGRLKGALLSVFVARADRDETPQKTRRR